MRPNKLRPEVVGPSYSNPSPPCAPTPRPSHAPHEIAPMKPPSYARAEKNTPLPAPRVFANLVGSRTFSPNAPAPVRSSCDTPVPRAPTVATLRTPYPTPLVPTPHAPSVHTLGPAPHPPHAVPVPPILPLPFPLYSPSLNPPPGPSPRRSPHTPQPSAQPPSSPVRSPSPMRTCRTRQQGPPRPAPTARAHTPHRGARRMRPSMAPVPSAPLPCHGAPPTRQPWPSALQSHNPRSTWSLASPRCRFHCSSKPPSKPPSKRPWPRVAPLPPRSLPPSS